MVLLPPSKQLTRALGHFIAVGIALFLAARLGLVLRTQTGFAVFWPAAGVAVSALIVFGRNARLAIAAAIATATIASSLTIGRSPWLAIAIGLACVSQALLTAYLIESWFGRSFTFDDVRHVVGFVASAGLGAAPAGVAGAVAIILLHSPAPFWEVWRAWFLSDVVGTVVVAPFLIGLAQLWREQPSTGEWIEGVSVLAILVLTSLYVVTRSADSWVTFSPAALVLPFLLWLTARGQPAWGIAGAFIAASAVLLGMTFGAGRFGDASVAITERIKGAQAAMTVVTIYTLVLSALFTEKRHTEAALKRAAEHQSMLVAELNHRVKNVLATISAVASRTQSASVSAADFVAKLAGRIQSMAATHELISRREWNGIPVRELVQRELAPYVGKINTDIDGPDLILTPDSGQAVSIVLHELATNAAKYGALSTTNGRVSVRWNRDRNGNGNPCLCIKWRETGGPIVQIPRNSSYGTEVIRNLIPYELGGTVELVFGTEGVLCDLYIPLPRAEWR